MALADFVAALPCAGRPLSRHPGNHHPQQRSFWQVLQVSLVATWGCNPSSLHCHAFQRTSCSQRHTAASGHGHSSMCSEVISTPDTFTICSGRTRFTSSCQDAKEVLLPAQDSRRCGSPAAGKRPEDDGHVVKGQTGHGSDSKAGRFYVQFTGFPFPLVHLPWSG